MPMSSTRSTQHVTKTEAESENGMVTAMHPLAAEAGVTILRQGGNAFDAAIATALAVGVVEPFMSGLGGTLYALAYDAKKRETTCFDGSARVPLAATEDMFELVPGDEAGSGLYGWRKTKDDASETGYRSVAVPGAMAALEKLHTRGATFSWEQLAAPALRLARDGFDVDEYLFVHCAAAAARLRPYPSTVEIFYDAKGGLRVPGQKLEPERLSQPALARTLEILAKEGPRVFYQGRVADEMIGHLRAHGGVLSHEDLEAYEASEASPTRLSYRQHRIELLPGPSGGATLALALNILAGFDLPNLPPEEPAHVHLVAETLRIAFADRFRFLADPFQENVPLDALLSEPYAATRRRWLSPEGPRIDGIPPGDPWPFSSTPKGRQRQGAGDAGGQHTTHLNAADGDGNVVALTATLGARFGSGVTVPESGVVLNNGMMWFDPEPGRLNSLRPGKRALHAAAPTLVFRDGAPILAVGAPGARKIMSAVLQVLLNVIDHDASIQDAIQAPRVHGEVAPPLIVDSHHSAAVIEGLRSRGHELAVRNDGLLSSYFGRPSGIRIDRAAGRFRGGVDPYRAATAVGY